MAQDVVRNLREAPPRHRGGNNRQSELASPPARMPRTRQAFLAGAVVVAFLLGGYTALTFQEQSGRRDVLSVLAAARHAAGGVTLPPLWEAQRRVGWVLTVDPENADARELEANLREKIAVAVLNQTRVRIREEADRDRRAQYQEFRDRGLAAWRRGFLEDASAYLEIALDTFPTSKVRQDLYALYGALADKFSGLGQPETARRYAQEARKLASWRRGKPVAPRTFADTRISQIDGSKMILVADGWIQMGSSMGAPDERPVHSVYIPAFYLDESEVTNAQYQRFLAATGRKEPRFWRSRLFDRPRQPVVGVTWDDAAAYARWSGKRLPTEAEWERAAREGGNGIYPWGSEPTVEPGITRACFARPVLNPAEPAGAGPFSRPLRIGSFPLGATALGLLDMAGNAAEWVADWYSPTYYQSSPETGPTGPEQGVERVLRGGSWRDAASRLTVSARGHMHPGTAEDFIGFRCASSADS